MDSSTYTLLKNLVEYIRANYSPEEKESLSKDGSKTTFFRKGGKSLCYVSEKNGQCAVTVVIGASLNEKIQSSPVSEKAKKMFIDARQFHDGKWLFFDLKTKKDIKDIKELLLIKRPLMKK